VLAAIAAVGLAALAVWLWPKMRAAPPAAAQHPASHATAAPAADCASGDTSCSIPKPAPSVVEVPPQSSAQAGAPMDPATARAKFDEMLKSPGVQQLLARQVHSQLEEIDAALHLTPEQKAKLATLLDRQMRAGVAMSAAVFGAGGGASAEDVAGLQHQIEDVFTPEQREQYDQYRRTKSEQMRARQRDVEENSLIGALGLEASQREEVEKLVSASQAATPAALSDEERSELVRPSTSDSERSAAFKKMLDKDVEDPQLTSQLRAVLKPEQFERYQQYIARKQAERERMRAMLATPGPATSPPAPIPASPPAGPP